MFKADLHIHTIYSSDSIIKPDTLISMAEELGLNAIAITEHDNIEGALKIKKQYSNHKLIIIPGVEFTLPEGHLIGLNITGMPYKPMELPELIEFIHENGGISILAHPYDIFRGFRDLEKNIKDVDAIEAANASDLRLYKNMEKALTLSHKYGKGYTAGSDAHVPEALGKVYLYTEDELKTIDEIIDYILNRKFKIYAEKTPFLARLKKYLKKI